MKYISGIHALNLTCNLDTCGDWHQSAIQWENLNLKESKGSIWGDYGIETNKKIPEHTECYNAANHIRALLDLIADSNFSVAQGMRKDYICTDKYNNELFEKIYQLRDMPNWIEIDKFMGREYCGKWLDFKENLNNGD